MPVAVLIRLIMPIVFSVLIVLIMLVIFAVRFIVGTVVGDINIVVPSVLDEIDRPVAGMVLVAVLGPFFRMSGRDMEIERFMYNVDRRRVDDDGFGVNQLGPGGVAYINLSVKSGLADAH